MTPSLDLTDAFAKLERRIKHSHTCQTPPCEDCLDRDDAYDGGYGEDSIFVDFGGDDD